MNSEPGSLSPHHQKGSGSQYILGQIFAPLLRLENGKLVPHRARCTALNPTRVRCLIFADAKWSDGKPLMAADYLRSFQGFLQPHLTKAFRPDLLFDLKNSKEIFLGKKSLNTLGMVANGKQIEFTLESPNQNFLSKLAHPLLSPLPDSPLLPPEQGKDFPSAGPFRIESWIPQKEIWLRPNLHFDTGATERPRIQVRLILEETVAFALYEKGELDFLRRIPTQAIPPYKLKKDFHSFPQIRFDYIGLRSDLSENLRLLIVRSLEYSDLQQILSSPPRPGCLGIPLFWHKQALCYNSGDESELASLRKKVEQEPPPPPLEFWFSKAGGDDHRRVAEWMQNRWQKNADLKVQIVPMDDKIFIERLRTSPPALFRKGLVPESLSCSGVLESFRSQSPENYLGIQDPDLDQKLDALRKATGKKDQAETCQQALNVLWKKNRFIPTGPIEFSILLKPEWSGLRLNELNQLDLLNLRKRSPSTDLKTAPAQTHPPGTKPTN